MLSLVEKLENLQAGLDNDTYIDVILQSLPLSYDPFVVNYNKNELEKFTNELINMLVQYETTTKKSEPSLLVEEASTSEAKGKGPRRWKRKKGKAKAAASALRTPVAPVGMDKGKGKVGFEPIMANDVCMHCREKGHWKREYPKLLSSAGTFVIEVNMITNFPSWVLDTGCGVHICNNLQVLERIRKLSRDEVVLKLGDGKAVAAEAVGIVHLVVMDQHDLIMTAQNKRKMYNQENAQIWHARLGHISQDRIKRLVDSKSLEIDDLDHLPACESCLQGKMTKKPFVGQSMLASGLLDLIHSDVCGPLNTQAKGGFSYFITFTDDHSRYGYVYLTRYKSEAFERFKEFRLEVENQTGRKIKTLWSDRVGEYLSGEFLDYLKVKFSLSGLL
ncbi:UNVERIFIED_CONTAM: hypothetical protein Slati_4436300 [Sesamum latifolium]|uniref:Integrase catalytic domain-containing protein n=1 Tax=Sesamum latifolium TaxID=2727402 RepID=A0AAW2SQ58_9LAMI